MASLARAQAVIPTLVCAEGDLAQHAISLQEIAALLAEAAGNGRAQALALAAIVLRPLVAAAPIALGALQRLGIDGKSAADVAGAVSLDGSGALPRHLGSFLPLVG
jgi:hypothetical protein